MIEKILSAFSTTLPPDEKNIVAAEVDHLGKCDECRAAQEFFAGRTKEDILNDSRNYPHLVNAFDLFTPQTWHYYLPVFLIQDLLRGRHRFDTFWHHDGQELIEGYWSPRIDLLDNRQCEMLLEYLESCRGYAIESGREEEFCRVLEWWQRIDREKLATIPWRV
jgi:hypothetical protein